MHPRRVLDPSAQLGIGRTHLPSGAPQSILGEGVSHLNVGGPSEDDADQHHWNERRADHAPGRHSCRAGGATPLARALAEDANVSDELRGAGIGLVFQEPRLLPWRTAIAMRSGGMPGRNSSGNIAVSTLPGQSALTVMPAGANSSASDCVKPIRPNFEVHARVHWKFGRRPQLGAAAQRLPQGKPGTRTLRRAHAIRQAC